MLPCANLPEILPDPSALELDSILNEAFARVPADWQGTVACPLCGHVSTFEYQDIGWEHRETEGLGTFHSDTICHCVEFLCARSDCRTPVKFHALELPTPEKVYEQFHEGFFVGKCPNGHDLMAPPRERCQISRVIGLIL